jgi:hypothetical protein
MFEYLMLCNDPIVEKGFDILKLGSHQYNKIENERPISNERIRNEFLRFVILRYLLINFVRINLSINNKKEIKTAKNKELINAIYAFENTIARIL